MWQSRLPGGGLGEPDEFPAGAKAAVARDDGEHAELADLVIENLKADAADDFRASPGHG